MMFAVSTTFSFWATAEEVGLGVGEDLVEDVAFVEVLLVVKLDDIFVFFIICVVLFPCLFGLFVVF